MPVEPAPLDEPDDDDDPLLPVPVDPLPVDPLPVEPEPVDDPLVPVPRPPDDPVDPLVPLVPYPVDPVAEFELFPRLDPDDEEDVPSLFMLPARDDPLLARFVSYVPLPLIRPDAPVAFMSLDPLLLSPFDR